jgi:hypothetical protein
VERYARGRRNLDYAHETQASRTFSKELSSDGKATCQVCREKHSNLKDHQYSGISKCIDCGGQHNSNDSKLPVVKDYRAALTRNILSNMAPLNAEYNNAYSPLMGFPIQGPPDRHLPHSMMAL